MVNYENGFEIPEGTIRPDVLGFDQISTVADKYVELAPGIEERNQRVMQEYGDDARLLEIIDNNTLVCPGRKVKINYGSTFVIMNTLFSYPDSLIERRMLPLLSEYAKRVVDQINDDLGAGEPIIETRDVEGSVFVHYGLAENLILIDRRPKTKGQTETPLSIEEPADVAEQASAESEPAPQPEPACEEPADSTEQDFDISNVLPRVASLAELKSSKPERFVLITNTDELNERTLSQLESINKTRPPDNQIKPNRLHILDDTHAKFNGLDYDYGPFARSVLNQLLANYLSPSMIAIRGLSVPADPKSSYDNIYAPRKVELFIQELKTRGIVFVRPSQAGVLVTLRPVIIRDLRDSPKTSADKPVIPGEHPDIMH